ncbi:MAG: class I SAM-dependent methyltransferase [Planctomycetota bacterium]
MHLQTESVSCNACGADDFQPISAETYRLQDAEVSLGVVRCNSCQLVYTNPRLTRESTLQVYQHDTEHTISSNYCWSGDHTSARFAPLLRRLRAYAPAGRLLDVGCGSGDFLRVASTTGQWELTGIEPVPDAAAEARQSCTATIHTSVLEEVSFEPRAFDVISMLGVLEHVHDPAETLQTAHKLLKPGGLLAIYVPNFSYLRFKDLGSICLLRTGRWSDLHPQEHQFQFTQQTLKALLDSNGFDVLRIDVGRPFAVGSPAKRLLKNISFRAVQALWKMTGVHLGGLEVIARVQSCEPNRKESRTLHAA